MPYESFTLTTLREKFGVEIQQADDLYGDIPPAPPSELLMMLLERNTPLVFGKASEKARSELIIAPVLVEVREMLKREIVIFSGVKFDVDKKDGLFGYCDFLISRDPLVLEVEAPVVALAEAKKEDLGAGTAQCIAEMIAAQRFNERRGKAISPIYGVVTSGTDWRFLQLEGKTVTLDLREYPITELSQILGILVFMASM